MCIVISIRTAKSFEQSGVWSIPLFQNDTSCKGNKHGSMTSIAFVLLSASLVARHTAISLGLRAEKHQKGRLFMSIKEKLASMKASNKELTPKQQKVRTILNWVATAVCIVIIVFALVVAIFMISGASNEEKLMKFGDKIYMNVASNSMSPMFTKNDVIIVESFEKDVDLDKIKIGQIVTYKMQKGTHFYFNTHRIIALLYDENHNLSQVVTRGDNQDGTWQAAAEEYAKNGSGGNFAIIGKRELVDIEAIRATWGSINDDGTYTSGKMLKGCGAFSNWIQDQDPENGHFGDGMKVRFFCVVVLPLILLFVVYAFVLIRTLVIAKLENQNKVQAAQVVTVDSLSDEEKRRLAQEYLASLANDSSDPTKVVQDVQEDDEPQSTVDDVQTMDESVDEQCSDDNVDNQ